MGWGSRHYRESSEVLNLYYGKTKRFVFSYSPKERWDHVGITTGKTDLFFLSSSPPFWVDIWIFTYVDLCIQLDSFHSGNENTWSYDAKLVFMCTQKVH